MIFIAGILILAGVLWLGFQIAGKRSHNMIRITVDGKEFGTYSLSQDRVIHIGDTNVCEIKDGKVTMIEAPAGSLLYETEGCGQARRIHHLPS